ncbi:hypothetical protein [Sagittula sp. SSi028]|uniref:hypothetical protein n=1 Tax=Sagittula sp. SSi028 TaxID=3400636 RepID=UPI003AF7A825
MLQDKRNDLDAERQKRLLQRMVAELSGAHPDIYYTATTDIAAMLQQDIAEGRGLNQDERALMQRLTRRDIEVMLSLH